MGHTWRIRAFVRSTRGHFSSSSKQESRYNAATKFQVKRFSS
jgi:hypothetical protein